MVNAPICCKKMGRKRCRSFPAFENQGDGWVIYRSTPGPYGRHMEVPDMPLQLLEEWQWKTQNRELLRLGLKLFKTL